jgi:acyl-CoA synthetase (NDP forming)
LNSIDELPAIPDVVFVGVPADATIEIVQQLNDLGVGGAVCLASGFKEVSDGGEDRQHRLLEAAGDMPVLGPNCYGYINTLLGAALFPDQHGLTRTEEGVAIVSSSGNIGINFTLQQRGLPISWLITIGNQAVIGIEEAVSAALENPKIKAIGLHIEGLNNLPFFIELANQAREKRIPIVVLKTGKSDIGARITLSHTATLAGETGLYEALFERLGVGLVDNIEEFLETLKLACMVGPLSGNRISSMSCSGGEASLIADLSVKRNLEFPAIENDHRDLLRSTLNEYVAIDNPLDYHTFIWGDEERMVATFSAMMKGNYDLSLLVIDFPFINDCDYEEWIDATRAFQKACQDTNSKGAIVSCMSENFNNDIRQRLIDDGITPLQGMDQALTAIETVSKIGMAWSRNESLPEISLIQGEVNVDNVVGLDEYKAKQLLANFGVDIPNSVVWQDGKMSFKEKENLAFPLVLKAISSDIAHKSELGAVVLGIDNLEELQNHAKQLNSLSLTLLVEEQVSGSVAELLIGVSYDALFGHYLILGFGGTMVELIGDREILMFPLQRSQILAALKRLKTWPLLDGFRGRKKADLDAIVITIESISNLINDKGHEIVELEINPLMVRPENFGAVAADALIRKLQ